MYSIVNSKSAISFNDFSQGLSMDCLKLIIDLDEFYRYLFFTFNELKLSDLFIKC